MKISVFTTATNAKERSDLLSPALDCYAALADEVVCIEGGIDRFSNRYVAGKKRHHQHGTPLLIHPNRWPVEFSWEFIGHQFQTGYRACIGDWVIHADLDFIFHENDYDAIGKAFEEHKEEPALSFWKYLFILPDRYNLKSRLVVAVNKGKYGDRIRFDSGGDLAQPSLDGKYISPDDVPEARVPIWCYEKILKSEAQIKDDVGRMARAWQRHFGEYKLSGPDDESAYAEWWKMTEGRYNKPQEIIPLSDHPKVMQETIQNLKPEQFGYNGFGRLKGGYFAQSR